MNNNNYNQPASENKIDSQLIPLINALQKQKQILAAEKQLSIQEIRKTEKIITALIQEYGAVTENVSNTINTKIPGQAGEIPVRIYQPSGNGPFPILVYIHGGGWAICSLDSHDNVCRSLANRGSCIVVSVDYRLSPENKFPDALNDVYAVLSWLSQYANQINGDAKRIAVGGDSAGGNLAAAVCLKARDESAPLPVYQLLIYPVIDLTSFQTESYLKYGSDEYLLSRESMSMYKKYYLNNDDDAENPYVSPLKAKDLSRLPPAMVITAEFDPLRDEGKEYAKRLNEYGTSAEYRCYTGMIHGFFEFSGISDQAELAVNHAVKGLRHIFAANQDQHV